jgi:hypothetical protein
MTKGPADFKANARREATKMPGIGPWRNQIAA